MGESSSSKLSVINRNKLTEFSKCRNQTYCDQCLITIKGEHQEEKEIYQLLLLLLFTESKSITR